MLNVITLFSGYDSQCLALDRLKRHNPQFDYDLVAWAEIDPHAIKAHNALFPQWQDRNLGDVSKVDWQAKAADFGCQIDLLTYSSPCQDFSSAGLQKGGQQGSGTRSSLLWECERAIEHLRPKYLLFENVSALVSEKFRPTFFKWCLTLERLGYTNHYQLMNAKDYGVPQNRLRIFMVSILGDHVPYYFPKPFPLDKRLKDVLETNVPDRYYLSQERLAGLKLSNEKEKEAGRGFEFAPKGADSVVANAVSTNAGGRKTDNYLQEPIINKVGYYSNSQAALIVDGDGVSTAVINGDHAGTPKIADPVIDIVANLDPNDLWQGSVIRSQNQVIGPNGISLAVGAKYSGHPFKIVEPLPAAARGRAAGDWHTSEHRQTLELGDPAAANSVTSVAKDNMIIEPAILQQQRTEEGKEIRRQYKTDKGIPYAHKELAPRGDGISNTLSPVEKDNLLAEPAVQQVGQLVPDSKFANPHRGRIDSPAGVAPTVDTAQGGNLVAKIIEQAKTAHPSRGIIMIKNTPCWVRRLTERELFRLMDVDEPDIDTLLNAGISNTQLAKLAGNSIVVACLYHIFRNLFVTTDPTPGTQTTLF